VPVAVETFGACGPDATSFLTDFGRRIATFTGEPRSMAFLKQKIDVALQRGNAASLHPISNLSILSKLLERFVVKQVLSYLTLHSLL